MIVEMNPEDEKGLDRNPDHDIDIDDELSPEPGSESGMGPRWILEPSEIASQITKALGDHELETLADRCSAFGDRVDWYLIKADQAIMVAARRIDELSRPNPYSVRRP